jgi:hypothetical protein
MFTVEGSLGHDTRTSVLLIWHFTRFMHSILAIPNIDVDKNEPRFGILLFISTLDAVFYK